METSPKSVERRKSGRNGEGDGRRRGRRGRERGWLSLSTLLGGLFG